jgi:hypothetical protein
VLHMAMKALVVGNRRTLARIIAQCHTPATKDCKARFGNDDAEMLFKVEGEKLVKLREQTEKGKAIVAEMKELWGDDENFDEDNCNEDGYQLQDEWYVEDLDIQRARSVLKKLLHAE